MRGYIIRSAKAASQNCLQPHIQELDEGAGRSKLLPAAPSQDWSAPASRQSTVGTWLVLKATHAQCSRFYKLAVVVLMACFNPMSSAQAAYDFTPVQRDSGTSRESGQLAACHALRAERSDLNQRTGREDLEAEFVAKERQLLANRADHGLYHEIHTPVFEHMAELALRMNNIHKAQEYQEAALLIKKRLYKTDHTLLAKAYSQWADWHFDRYAENLGRPSVLLGTGHDSMLLTLHFSVSDEYYTRALHLLNQQPGTQCERKHLRSRLKALYYSALNLAPMPARDHRQPGDIDSGHYMGIFASFRISPSTIRDLLTPADEPGVLNNPALVQSSALELVELADWYALFNNYDQARFHYETAWQVLHGAGHSQQEIERILSFGLPIPEPDELLQPRDAAPPARGHIDVDVKLNIHGELTAVWLVNDADHDTRMARNLLSEIRTSRFRPVVRDGIASDQEVVALRYIY